MKSCLRGDFITQAPSRSRGIAWGKASRSPLLPLHTIRGMSSSPCPPRPRFPPHPSRWPTAVTTIASPRLFEVPNRKGAPTNPSRSRASIVATNTRSADWMGTSDKPTQMFAVGTTALCPCLMMEQIGRAMSEIIFCPSPVTPMGKNGAIGDPAMNKSTHWGVGTISICTSAAGWNQSKG